MIERHGPWRFFNFHLRDGVFTMSPEAQGLEARVAPVIALAEDLAGPIEGMRALDLGCMEGLFTIELALRGAEAVGIEGRETNLARAEFAREAMDLGLASFHLDDVRGLSPEQYGEFDVVLALGILYHLDAPDVFDFVHRVARVTKRVAIFDTHYSLRAATSWHHGGADYSGIVVREHDPTDTDADRERSYASSIENLQSVWLTKESLFNLLADAGFANVLEVRIPHIFPEYDRVHLVGVMGAGPVEPVSTPHLDPWSSPRWKQGERPRASRQQSIRERTLRRVAGITPAPIRRALIARRRSGR